MARTQLILPQADSTCGKVFHADRRTAEEHRIALEVWNRATGRAREGYQLAVFRCKQCGGFHLRQRRIESIRPRTDPRLNRPDEIDGREIDRVGGPEDLGVRRAGWPIETGFSRSDAPYAMAESSGESLSWWG